MQPPLIRFGHGPDADDAFVFEPLVHGRVSTGGLELLHSHLPFDELNRRAGGRDPFEVTMLSVASLARLTHRWLALPFGGSFVRTMGPTVVARRLMRPRDLAGALVAVPGRGTTAALLLRLFDPELRTVVVPYAEIAEAVARRHVDAGVVIHEGQVDFTRHGLVRVLDLGRRWKRVHRLPTPLAVCAVRADLPAELRVLVVAVLERSLAAARADPQPALEFARRFDGGLGGDTAERLVEEYVSEDTYRLGERARAAVELLVRQAQALDAPPALAFADAA